MNNFIKYGRLIFGTGFLGLSILCIVSKDFIVGRPPAWPAGVEINPALAYVSGSLLFILAGAIIIQRKGALAAFIIALLILVLSVFRYIPEFMNNWVGAYKTLAFVGGALIIACSFLNEDDHLFSTTRINERLQNILITTGCILLTLFFIAGGYAHFKFADFVRDLIPSYIPFRGFWTYFTAVCLIAGGVGILIPKTRKLAALLSGIMVMGWFLLLHIPRFAANTSDAGERLGLFESFTFAGIFFVLAGMSSKK